MKKIFVILFALCAVSAQAQLFVGGSGKIGYSNDTFSVGLLPEVGYEINDRWAVGVGLGLETITCDGDSEVFGLANPFVRFTAWQNDRIALDVKGISMMEFQREFFAANIGVRPSVRFKVNDHLHFYTDFGLIGATDNNGDWDGAFLFNAMNANLGISYKF